MKLWLRRTLVRSVILFGTVQPALTITGIGFKEVGIDQCGKQHPDEKRALKSGMGRLDLQR